MLRVGLGWAGAILGLHVVRIIEFNAIGVHCGAYNANDKYRSRNHTPGLGQMVFDHYLTLTPNCYLIQSDLIISD